MEKMWYALGKIFAEKGPEVVQVSKIYSDMPEQEWINRVFHKRIRGYQTPSSGVHLKWLDLLYTLRARSVMPIDSDIIVTNTFWAPIVLSSNLRRRCIVDVARMPKGQMRLYNQASRLRANSSSVAKAIKSELPASQHGRVVVIPNPIPFWNLPQIDLGLKKPVMLYVGRIHPEKGLELLIKAFKALGGKWKLQIVGPSDIGAGGGGRSYIESLKLLADGGNIEFKGPVYDMEVLNRLYAEASVFVYPSLAEQGETFGLAPLEAMAWGCVPVISDLTCFRDFIRHEKNGVVFNHRSEDPAGSLKEAIERLKINSILRFELATQALKVRQSHAASVIASQFLDEFERVIYEKKSSNPVIQ